MKRTVKYQCDNTIDVFNNSLTLLTTTCLTTSMYSHQIFLRMYRHAKSEPGLAEPHVKGPITLEPLDIVVLMTDGVYNSMEIIYGSKDPSALKELLESTNYCAKQVLTTITDSIYKMYEENIDKSDAESQAKAQLARKHDDMTLSVIRYQCKFETSF